MNLWNMSISGGIFIVAIIMIRNVLQNRLSRWVFQVLWLAVFLRLMIPFSIPFQFSIYSLAETCGISFADCEMWEEDIAENRLNAETATYAEDEWENRTGNEMEAKTWDIHTLWIFIYLCGATLCALYYVIVYLRCHRAFKASYPIEDSLAQTWVDEFPLRRRVSVRQWDTAVSPLTYGVFHPVILIPVSLGKGDMEQLRMVLVHETMHIRHFDAVKKMMLILACCVHWFNPLVWIMSILANREMEIMCDENVIRYLGRDMRSAYALTLLDMEERRNIRVSWGNSFSKNAMEERVIAIMKEKKKSILTGILSGVLTAVVIMIFTTSAYAIGRAEKTVYVQADDEMVEGNAYQVEADGGIVKVRDEAVAATEDVSSNTEESNSAPEVPEEYVPYGITANPHTAGWEYQGKQVAVFYDKGRFLSTNGVSGKDVVYLEVCRDRKGEIEDIKERSKKEMQKILKPTGLEF